MDETARADFAASGRSGTPILDRTLDLRYRRQTHSVEVPLGEAVDDASLARLIDRFELRYSDIYGPGTGYRAAGIELTTVRVYATLPGTAARASANGHDAIHPDPEPRRRRDVYFDGWCPDVPVYDGALLAAGAKLGGPALIEWATTTLLIHPGQEAAILPGGHARLTFPNLQ